MAEGQGMAEEVPPGYKRTEVGVVPEEWSTCQIGDFCTTYTGGTPLTSRPDYYGGNIPWITSGDLNARRVTDVAGRITQKGFEASATKMVKPGDLLIALYGATAGVIAVVEINAAINQAILAISTDTCDKEYLFQHLASRKNRIVETYTQGGQPNLSGGIIRSLTVVLPPLPEQRAIAAALSDADGLIRALDALIEKKRAIKQAAMQQLLTGKERLPGFEGEWRDTTLDQLIESCSSGATPYRGRADFYKGRIKWITSGELEYRQIMDTREHISEEAVRKTNLKLHPPGTFLMAITGLEAEGTRGSCGIVGAEAATNQSCMVIYPNCELHSGYLFHYYVFRGKSLALQYCQGTKQQSYTAKTVKLLPIRLPVEINEQRAIATVLSDMDAEIAALKRRRDKTNQVKQGMMQELLTGRTRLIDPLEAPA